MPITGTKAFTSEVLTSSDVNRYLMRGVKVYGNTTDRDNAYGGAGEPVLEEGETAYLTDTDKLQVYGGTAAGWVNIGPPGAAAVTAIQSATVATSQTTTSTSYTDLSTSGPAVTITTGTSALVTICCTLSNGDNGPSSYMSQAISGATTVAASDVNAIRFAGGVWASGFGSFAKTFLVTGLTAGSNTFTAKYRVTSSTGTFFDRTITVMAL